jgi:hypothetical protein
MKLMARINQRDIEELARQMCDASESVDGRVLCATQEMPVTSKGHKILPPPYHPYPTGVMELWRTYIPLAKIALEFRSSNPEPVQGVYDDRDDLIKELRHQLMVREDKIAELVHKLANDKGYCADPVESS